MCNNYVRKTGMHKKRHSDCNNLINLISSMKKLFICLCLLVPTISKAQIETGLDICLGEYPRIPGQGLNIGYNTPRVYFGASVGFYKGYDDYSMITAFAALRRREKRISVYPMVSLGGGHSTYLYMHDPSHSDNAVFAGLHAGASARIVAGLHFNMKLGLVHVFSKRDNTIAPASVGLSYRFGKAGREKGNNSEQ